MITSQYLTVWALLNIHYQWSSLPFFLFFFGPCNDKLIFKSNYSWLHCSVLAVVAEVWAGCTKFLLTLRSWYNPWILPFWECLGGLSLSLCWPFLVPPVLSLRLMSPSKQQSVWSLLLLPSLEECIGFFLNRRRSQQFLTPYWSLDSIFNEYQATGCCPWGCLFLIFFQAPSFMRTTIFSLRFHPLSHLSFAGILCSLRR